MNVPAGQQTSSRRSADLSPFEMTSGEHNESEQRPRNSAAHRLVSDAILRSAERDAAYGCVEWYLYARRQAAQSDAPPA